MRTERRPRRVDHEGGDGPRGPESGEPPPERGELAAFFERFEFCVGSLSTTAILPHLTLESRWDHLSDVLLGQPQIRGGARPRDYPLGLVRRASSALACQIAVTPRRFGAGISPKWLDSWAPGAHQAISRVELGPWLVGVRLGWLAERELLTPRQRENLALRLCGLVAATVIQSLAQERDPQRKKADRVHWLMHVLGFGAADRTSAGLTRAGEYQSEASAKGTIARDTDSLLKRIDQAATVAAMASIRLQDLLDHPPSKGFYSRAELLTAPALMPTKETTGARPRGAFARAPELEGTKSRQEFLGLAWDGNKLPPNLRDGLREAQKVPVRIVKITAKQVVTAMNASLTYPIERGISAFAAQTMARVRDHLCSPASALPPMSILSDTEGVIELASAARVEPAALQREVARLLNDHIPSASLTAAYPRLADTLGQSLVEGRSLLDAHPGLELEVRETTLLGVALECAAFDPEFRKKRGPRIGPDRTTKGPRPPRGERCSGLRHGRALESEEHRLPGWYAQHRKGKEQYGPEATAYSLAGGGYHAMTTKGLIDEIRASTGRWLVAEPREKARSDAILAELREGEEPVDTVETRFLIRFDGNAVGKLFLETPALLRPRLSLQVEAEVRRRVTDAVVRLVKEHPSLRTLPVDLHYLGGDDAQLVVPGALFHPFLAALTTKGPPGEQVQTPPSLQSLSFKLGAVELPPRADRATEDKRQRAHQIGTATAKTEATHDDHVWQRRTATALMSCAPGEGYTKFERGTKHLKKRLKKIPWDGAAYLPPQDFSKPATAERGAWQCLVMRLAPNRAGDEGS